MVERYWVYYSKLLVCLIIYASLLEKKKEVITLLDKFLNEKNKNNDSQVEEDEENDTDEDLSENLIQQKLQEFNIREEQNVEEEKVDNKKSIR